MSSVSPELLEILVCPETKQPVVPAEAALLERLNEQIRAGRVRTRGGRAVSEPIAEALVREDQRILYTVDDGIPVMLIEESISLEDDTRS
jgi:uncharacterized protein YbaR (Trm112 family)